MIRPDVVKAMIMDETSWGKPGGKNAGRDVMQVLYSGDYGLWILSGYDPTEEKMRHADEENPNRYYIWTVDQAREQVYSEADIRTVFNFYENEERGITATNKAGFGDGLGILRDNVITIIDKSDENLVKNIGEYKIYYDRVTPNMSIACGTAYLAYNMQEEKGEKAGVDAYNGGGAEATSGKPYVDKVNEKLSYLRYDDGSVPEPLKE